MSIASSVVVCVCCCYLTFLLLCIAEVCGEYFTESSIKINDCNDVHNKRCYNNVQYGNRWFVEEEINKELKLRAEEAAFEEKQKTSVVGDGRNGKLSNQRQTQDLTDVPNLHGTVHSTNGNSGDGEEERIINGTPNNENSLPVSEHLNKETLATDEDSHVQTSEIKDTTLTSPIPKIENSVSQPESVTNSEKETENDNQKKDSEETAEEIEDQNSDSQTGQFNNENNEQPLFESLQKPTETPSIFSSATVTNTVGDSATAEITASMKKPLNLIFVFLLFSILPGCVLVL